MATNYMGASLSSKTNEIVCYKPISYKWVKQFRDDVLSREEAKDVELYVVQKSCDDGRGFGVSKGDTLLRLGESGKSIEVSRPWGATKTGTLPLKNLKLKPRINWSCEDVSEYVVKPQCMGIKSYYTDLLAQENPALVRKVDFDRGTFISYAQKMKFDELVNALDNYFENEPSVDRDSMFIWMDIFCANQPKLAVPLSQEELMKLRYDLLTRGLHHAISRFERKVIVFDDWKNPAPLKRAWCVWEVFGVAIARHELEIAMTLQQEDSFLSAFKIQKGFDDLLSSLAAIDMQSAKCHNQDDLKMIHTAIERHSSFTVVNEKVLGKLREWHVKVVKAELGKVQGTYFKGTHSESELLLLSSLSKLLWRQGKYTESMERAKQALEVTKALYGAEHEYVAVGLLNIATLLTEQGKFSEAEVLLLQARHISEKATGKEHLDHANILAGLGHVYQSQGKLADAKPVLEEALRIKRKALGNKHAEVAVAINNLGNLFHAQINHKTAEALFREGRQLAEENFGREHPEYAIFINNLAQVLTEKGESKEALELIEEAMKTGEKVFSESHPFLANCFRNKGRCLSRMGRYEEASTCFEKALEISMAQSGNMDIHVGKIRWWFAESLKAEGKATESKAQWKTACDIYKAKGLSGHPDYQKCLALWDD